MSCPLQSGSRRCREDRLLRRGRIRQTAALLCLATLVGGCRTALDPLALQDAQTAAEVKTVLVNDADVGPMTITVSVNQGVARLSGTVSTQALAEKAAALARSVQGVRGVELNLHVGRTEPAASDSPPGSVPPSQDEGLPDFDDDPRLFAIGASAGFSRPANNAFGSRAGFGPLFRIGSRRGLGTVVALNWFQTSLPGTSPVRAVESRIRVRPIMAGISYTLAKDRISLSPSLVAGVAFNSVNAPDEGAAEGVAVDVDTSFIWGPSFSVWVDVDRRVAVNLSVGYVMTRLQVTVVDGGRLVKQGMRGDTSLLHAGIAYKVF
jgi:hypothetical protein